MHCSWEHVWGEWIWWEVDYTKEENTAVEDPNRNQHAISCSQPPFVFIFVFVGIFSFISAVYTSVSAQHKMSKLLLSAPHFSQECFSGTWKGRPNKIHSQVENFFNSFPFRTRLNVSYQVSGSITVSAQVLSQHLLPSDNCLPWKHGSLLNFFPYKVQNRHPSRKHRSKATGSFMHWTAQYIL